MPASGYSASSSRSRSMRVIWVVILVSLFAGVAAGETALPTPKSDARSASPATKVLRGGWYPWDPYQYREYRRGASVLTGFDVEIERAIARVMGVELVLND